MSFAGKNPTDLQLRLEFKKTCSKTGHCLVIESQRRTFEHSRHVGKHEPRVAFVFIYLENQLKILSLLEQLISGFVFGFLAESVEFAMFFFCILAPNSAFWVRRGGDFFLFRAPWSEA